MTNPHSIVARDAWLEARLALLAKEKEFTRLRDQLNQQRHDLPWERVAKTYVYDGPDGAETLAQLFAGNSQLIAYHFMFALDWDSGCPSRSRSRCMRSRPRSTRWGCRADSRAINSPSGGAGFAAGAFTRGALPEPHPQLIRSGPE